MKRIFLAIDLSAEARSAVAEYVARLRTDLPRPRCAWERPEKLHLTLKFLGDTNDSLFDRILTITRSIAGGFSPFSISIRGTGVFPSAWRPRVLWLGVEGGSERLTEMNREFEERFEALGFPREKREFRPHLTIARVREPERGSALATRHLSGEFESPQFEVSGVAVYESKLATSGSTYRVIERCDFNQGQISNQSLG